MTSYRWLLSVAALVAMSWFMVVHKACAQAIKTGGGNPTLTVTTGVPGGLMVSVTNTATTLTYKRQSLLSKITVVTNCPGQHYSLSVVATSVTRGVAAPSVQLVNGNPAIDFVTSIPNSGFNSASCRLNYTAAPTFAQGNSSEFGDDTHTVTYTIQAQ